MLIVHVHVKVKPDYIDKFKKVSIENAENSIKEDGVARFDVLQELNDPSRFVLNEVYKAKEAPSAHKQTDHYKKWKEEVEMMMAEPRYSIQYEYIFPMDDEGK